MTICPTCYNKIPELALACPVCMRNKYLHALEQTEIGILPQIVNGKLPVKLLRVGSKGNFHLAYQDGFSKEPYCKAALKSPRPSYCSFSQRPNNLCHACLSMFHSFSQRAGIASAK